MQRNIVEKILGAVVLLVAVLLGMVTPLAGSGSGETLGQPATRHHYPLRGKAPEARNRTRTARA